MSDADVFATFALAFADAISLYFYSFVVLHQGSAFWLCDFEGTLHVGATPTLPT